MCFRRGTEGVVRGLEEVAPQDGARGYLTPPLADHVLRAVLLDKRDGGVDGLAEAVQVSFGDLHRVLKKNWSFTHGLHPDRGGL